MPRQFKFFSLALLSVIFSNLAITKSFAETYFDDVQGELLEAPHSMSLTSDEIAEALKQLKAILRYIDRTIEPLVETYEKPQILLLRKKTEKLILLLESKKALTAETPLAFLDLLESFKYSVNYFKRIETKASSQAIQKTFDIIKEIDKKWRQDGEDIYTKKTKIYFSQIRELLKKLREYPTIPDELRQKIEDPETTRLIVNAIALGELGDRPKAFAAGIAACDKMKALYPAFETVAGARDTFDITLEIMGINEVFAEYAQIEYTQKQSPKESETPQTKDVQANAKDEGHEK